MRVELEHVPLPDFGLPSERPGLPAADCEAAVARVYAMAGTDWVGVYGDREHFANLYFLTGHDPRFEEALLVLGPKGKRVLFVGSEGLVSAQRKSLDVDLVHYQPFSLMGQPLSSPPLDELLRAFGVREGDSFSLIGWKYFAPHEDEEWDAPAYVAQHVVRAFKRAVVTRKSLDATWTMMDPQRGVRLDNSAARLAQLEWGSSRASAAGMRMVFAARPGRTEVEVMSHMGYAGEPFAAHPTFTASRGQLDGLKSPSGHVLVAGEGTVAGCAYWGGCFARTGMLIDAPDEAFMAGFVRPYFRALTNWWSTIGIGVSGAELDRVVREGIGDAGWGPFLGAGHLTSYDEWLHCPMGPESTMTMRSGMAFQCDIIPTPMPDGVGIYCEDGLALADADLRARLAAEHPAVWARIQARRAFMQETLGIALKPEVLPFSAAPAYMPPAWLSPETVCVLRP